MTRAEAREIAKQHKFTRKELYDILKEALEKEPESFWTKPNRSNKSTDNGFYFNLARGWVDYKEGENDDEFASEMVTYRVLHIFGKYSKIQPPKKNKTKPKITMSQKPRL